MQNETDNSYNADNIVKPSDYNDKANLGGEQDIKEQVDKALYDCKDLSTQPLLPDGYRLTEDALFYEDKRISSRLDILGYTYKETNKVNLRTTDWCKFVSFNDSNGNKQLLPIPMELFGKSGGEVTSLLQRHGFQINKTNNSNAKLIEYLQNTKVSKKILSTSKVGWHGNKYFIFPDTIIPHTEEIHFDADLDNAQGFAVSGELIEWQEEIAKYCRGNNMLIFSLSCAFAAPMLQLIDRDSFGFNIVGASSTGKTTGLKVAASIYGSPKYTLTWRATGNALEGVAESRNNCLLCLDELGQVDARELGEIIYMLSHGSGKSRLKATGGLRKKFEWRSLFLSTGEVSISSAIKSVGGKVKGGMTMRLIDIHISRDSKYGLFDTIHNFKDANNLATHLNEKTGKIYGTPIREFISQLAKADKKYILQIFEELEKDFLAKYVPPNSNGQIQRIAKSFAIVAAGGELAIKLGIIPFEAGEAIEAIAQCFKLYIAEKDSIGSFDIDEAIKQIKTYFAQNYSTRFAEFVNPSDQFDYLEKIQSQAGFKRKVKSNGEDCGYEFFVFTEVFNIEICKGYDNKAVLYALNEMGYLIKGSEKQFVKNQRLPNIGPKKIYHFTTKILTDDIDGEV